MERPASAGLSFVVGPVEPAGANVIEIPTSVAPGDSGGPPPMPPA